MECTRGDSNSHGLPHTHLKRARLPFRHECRETKHTGRGGFVTEICAAPGASPSERFHLASPGCADILSALNDRRRLAAAA